MGGPIKKPVGLENRWEKIAAVPFVFYGPSAPVVRHLNCAHRRSYPTSLFLFLPRFNPKGQWGKSSREGASDRYFSSLPQSNISRIQFRQSVSPGEIKSTYKHILLYVVHNKGTSNWATEMFCLSSGVSSKSLSLLPPVVSQMKRYPFLTCAVFFGAEKWRLAAKLSSVTCPITIWHNIECLLYWHGGKWAKRDVMRNWIWVKLIQRPTIKHK